MTACFFDDPRPCDDFFLPPAVVFALAAVAVLNVGRHSTDATGVDADDDCCAGMALDRELHCVMTEFVRQSGQVVG